MTLANNSLKLRLEYLVIIILVIIILIMRNCDGVGIDNSPVIVTTYDTIWKTKHDTVVKTLKEVDIRYITPEGPQYTSGENIDTCKARFAYLLKEHSARRIYKDTIKLDSLGTITVIDTVWLNKLKDRTYINDYRIPLVTKTVTIIKAQQPKRQLYIGGNLFGDKTSLQSFTPGLLYKDRKDRIFQANIGVNFDGTLIFGAGTYWKINLNKK